VYWSVDGAQTFKKRSNAYLNINSLPIYDMTTRIRFRRRFISLYLRLDKSYLKYRKYIAKN